MIFLHVLDTESETNLFHKYYYILFEQCNDPIDVVGAVYAIVVFTLASHSLN